MAMAVQKLFPGAQVTIGPAIERGFYYDFDMPEPITEKDLKAVKKEMQRIIKADLPFTREEVSSTHACIIFCMTTPCTFYVQAYAMHLSPMHLQCYLNAVIPCPPQPQAFMLH